MCYDATCATCFSGVGSYPDVCHNADLGMRSPQRFMVIDMCCNGYGVNKFVVFFHDIIVDGRENLYDKCFTSVTKITWYNYRSGHI
jgi:hypothetical protein